MKKVCLIILAAMFLFVVSAFAKDVTESQIDDTFEGFEYDNVYKLRNGQIWIQTEHRYHYHYSYMPKVMIFESNSRYYMKVENVDGAVAVERLR